MKNLDASKIFRNLPEIKTKRLILRKITPADVKDVYAYASDPLVSRYTIWKRHKSLKESRRFIRYVLKEYRKGVPESWGIVLKENGRFIGTCGFNRYSACSRSAEIGYAMSRAYWGKGFMTEVVKAVIGFGFGKLKLNRISANAMLANKGSEKVMKKCGMKFEGIMREGVFAKGRFVDVKVYSILKKDRK